MCSWLLRCWGICLAVLVGCDGALSDYSGTRCNADGSCIVGYHCVRESWRCELGPVDASVCAITTCANADGCCPLECHANNDTDCPAVCGNLQEEPGEGCDDGNAIHEDDCPNTCTPNICGDNVLDRQEPRVEDCDDGNTITEQECAYGTRTCTLCDSTCTGPLHLTGRYCGDGIQDGSNEQCDDGNTSNQDNCLDTCSWAICGDGFLNTVTGEVCDDGDTIIETECPYGTPNCTLCNESCSTALNLEGRFCGDGIISHDEVCDDGNAVTETECPYGTPNCTKCNATCSESLNLTGRYCGDGVTSDDEVCDDRNTKDCGTCNSTCDKNQLAKATGKITAIASADLRDEDWFSVSDGVHSPVIFEFDKNGALASSAIPVKITITSSATQVAEAIANAFTNPVDINGAPITLSLDIVATSSSNIVTLTHKQEGSTGNQRITKRGNMNTSFKVSGMTGGGGFDCPEDTACGRTEDCEPELVCGNSRTCK